MKFFYFIPVCSFLLNNTFAQTHTFEREVQSNIFTLQIFKNPFDSSLYLWQDWEYALFFNHVNLAKTDTAGNILSNISFSINNLNISFDIIPFSNGFISGGSEYPFTISQSEMVRFDNLGNVIWAKRYSETNGFNLRPVIVDEVNNVILSLSNLANVTVSNPPVYIFKTDMNGNFISTHGYQIADTTGIGIVPQDLIKLNSGNYLLVANILICVNCYAQILLELDPALNVVSSKRLLTSQGDPAYSITYIKKPDDGFYVVGNFVNTFPSYDTHGFIINFSPTFSQLWAKYTNNTAGPYGLLFNDAKLTTDGGLIIGGTYTSASGYDDMMLIKVDSTGNLNWAKLIGENSRDERLSSFVYEPNDAIYLAGNGYDTALSAGTINGLFLKTDLSGNTTCGNNPLPVGFNTMNVILNNEPFSITIVAVTDSVLATTPLPGFTFVPSCDGVVSGIENNSNSYFSDIMVIPNPASAEFQISYFDFKKGDEIIIKNYLGENIFTKKISAPQSNVKFQISNYANGIYFLQLKTKEGVLNKKVMVQH